VARARTGDGAALPQLVQLREPRLLGEVEPARDVLQEARVEILRGLNGLRDDGAFLPWAVMIVSRRMARMNRGRQHDRRLAGEFAAEVEGTVPEGGPGAVDAARVRAAIGALPRELAATLALFYLENLSVAEVAMALGIPVGTMKTRLMHARKILRALLEGDGNGQG